MTLDERLAHDALAVEIVVHVGRVEVGEAPFEEGVDHAFDLGDVHGLEVAGLCSGSRIQPNPSLRIVLLADYEIDECPAAEDLQQHARQADAEVLHGGVERTREGPFAQCAGRLVEEYDGCQQCE